MSMRECEKPAQESGHPYRRQPRWNRERQEDRQWLCSHGGQVAQAARKASVPHRFRRMPPAPEVPVLQGEIRGYADFMPRGWAQDRAVVADAQTDCVRPRKSSARLMSNGIDQSQFAGNRSGSSSRRHRFPSISIPARFRRLALCIREADAYSEQADMSDPNELLRTRLEKVIVEGGAAVGDRAAMEAFLELRLALEAGMVRAAEPNPASPTGWRVNAWVKQGILLGFRIGQLQAMDYGLSFIDKDTYPARRFSAEHGVRIVPGGSSVRTGAFLARSVVMMPPSYVNVGAYVDEGTMIDSHALVGSCAQVGKRVHLSAAAQIGGVLEPVNASPVILEDDVLVGGNCGVYEGTIVRRKAVLAAGTILTRGTPLYDAVHGEVIRAEGDKPLIVPESAVVVPGARAVSKGRAREMGLSVYTPVIAKFRDEKTELSLALEDLLR